MRGEEYIKRPGGESFWDSICAIKSLSVERKLVNDKDVRVVDDSL